jgi:tRNA pseudouridine13 synthase
VRRLAAALGVAQDDIGSAGLKDRHAVTRQQLSLPPPITPEAALAVSVDGVRVLAAARHGHKLKTGHLAGNRFVLVVRELAVDAAAAAARARAKLERLGRPPGVPAWYGEQRFGQGGETAAHGWALLRGERVPGGPRERRLYASALQSELFNRWLEARLADGLYDRVLAGDVLRKVATGGTFVCAEPEVDQPRLEIGDLAPTGPMYGVEMRRPPEGTPARAREDAVLAEAGLKIEDFARVARLAEGTRRPAGFPLAEADARAREDGTLELRFALPAGAYATVVAEELQNPV